MQEKERYYSLIDCNGNFELRDYGSNREFHSLYELDDLLNQQDKRIKELENMNSRLSQGIYWGNGEHFCDVVKRLKQENQQLKKQLKNEEQSHDLCIKSFEEETDKLRKRIKFESDARKRFVAANQQLKKENGYFIFADGYDENGNEVHKQKFVKYKDKFKELVEENKKLNQLWKQLAVNELEKLNYYIVKNLWEKTSIGAPERYYYSYIMRIIERQINQLKEK